ncbi:5-oxoprolinase subunit PxpB [Antarcticibacterium flavum]|uniref:5-oxoprolinase subunit PxpB n=2 Tax=Flavobacteriaceae TaxID=49546 RepID=A0A5B7X7D7_9FLAO|nr:allophanate hydrolase subunit 1 [Antarcticibacterium sp. W02-3]QCY71357.1 5-oxoprolinase subunit PxpB [Antarcticibacterium flavum]
MLSNYTIKPMGEKAILLEFEAEISEKMLEKVLSLKNVLENFFIKERVEVINTYHSLLIIYPFTIEDVYEKISALKELLDRANIGKKHESDLFHIPVCYDPSFGWDLEFISEAKGLPFEEIINLHLQPIYTVYFVGFLPGFLYLGGLEKALQFSRKKEPRLEVPKGAVGIGENQTGIYPKTSPGGWQILGRAPVEIFDKNENPPCEISAGDKIKFYPIDLQEYEVVREQISAGKFQLKKEIYEGQD